MLLLQDMDDHTTTGDAAVLGTAATSAAALCVDASSSYQQCSSSTRKRVVVVNGRTCYPTRFELPIQLRKRQKDMARIFRTKVKDIKVSLRLNSNVSLAIAHLRRHHGEDCWVGGALEKVWLLMAAASPPQLLVFELWYGEDMIAADFGHPSMLGRGLYVATRFYDRSPEVKQLQPGFLLALLECKILRDAGCFVWDLGGVNLCPLMRYKWDLTGQPMERMVAMHVLKKIKDKYVVATAGEYSTQPDKQNKSSPPSPLSPSSSLSATAISISHTATPSNRNSSCDISVSVSANVYNECDLFAAAWFIQPEVLIASVGPEHVLFSVSAATKVNT
jgi:hypothetical protein